MKCSPTFVVVSLVFNVVTRGRFFFWTSFFCGTGIHPTTMNNHVAQFEKNGVEKLRLHPKCPLHTNPASTSIETMGDFSMAIQCTLP